MPKFMTRGEAETKRQKAAEFLRRIGNDDLADEFDSMSPEEYAEHKGSELLENPHRRKQIMARTKTAAELREEIAELKDQMGELESENESLQDQLDSIAEIVAPEEEDEEDEEDDDEEDDNSGE